MEKPSLSSPNPPSPLDAAPTIGLASCTHRAAASLTLLRIDPTVRALFYSLSLRITQPPPPHSLAHSRCFFTFFFLSSIPRNPPESHSKEPSINLISRGSFVQPAILLTPFFGGEYFIVSDDRFIGISLEYFRTSTKNAVSYTHLTLPTIYSV